MTPWPACGNTDVHMFHWHKWMDHHFKEHQEWCRGVCDCGRRGSHGPGDHK